jgi:hypothetical protein
LCGYSTAQLDPDGGEGYFLKGSLGLVAGIWKMGSGNLYPGPGSKFYNLGHETIFLGLFSQQ